MLLQTNSYVVPKDKRTEHSRLLNRFRQTLARLGCECFEVYEQTGANWSSESTGRFVQIMRFRDRKQQQAVQSGERTDPQAQALIREFCELINFPYQQQQGLFAVGFYNSVLPVRGYRALDDSSDAGVAAETAEAAPQGAGEAPIESPSDEQGSTPEVEAIPAATEDTALGGSEVSSQAEQEPPADPIVESMSGDDLSDRLDEAESNEHISADGNGRQVGEHHAEPQPNDQR